MAPQSTPRGLMSALALLLSLALAGCATAPAPVPAAAPGSAPALEAPDDNLNAVLWVQRSQEYQATLASLYRGAIAQLDAALADPQWDALVPSERDNPGAWQDLPRSEERRVGKEGRGGWEARA